MRAYYWGARPCASPRRGGRSCLSEASQPSCTTLTSNLTRLPLYRPATISPTAIADKISHVFLISVAGFLRSVISVANISLSARIPNLHMYWHLLESCQHINKVRKRCVCALKKSKRYSAEMSNYEVKGGEIDVDISVGSTLSVYRNGVSHTPIRWL
ncbi:hypothetical protein SODALDRAFT_180544 [Sodiomyces alkalinus F11]|uniref:Uncharacterized protein n=1 Tax=Sodiomyces alkalinus (strain CBS 110278 / VKM F-3762 / F11) TaxID=1314773 RepID=A0A3N2PU60_SODAK|nr:hypothetical protein SODALDRAFT_180544 [Sodiomyces alkalinus F11]ROT38058.1 hypothetical protein SODALDRAFT_180544 [Sodiomyces alkalinus F11]